MTVLVLDGAVLAQALVQAEDEDVIVVDPDAAELERLELMTGDPRVFFLIGDPAILPLPDNSIDSALGEGMEPELARVLRH